MPSFLRRIPLSQHTRLRCNQISATLHKPSDPLPQLPQKTDLPQKRCIRDDEVGGGGALFVGFGSSSGGGVTGIAWLVAEHAEFWAEVRLRGIAEQRRRYGGLLFLLR